MTKHITLQALAQELGLHAETLRRMARKGTLPGAYRLGRRWLVNMRQYEAQTEGTRHHEGHKR